MIFKHALLIQLSWLLLLPFHTGCARSNVVAEKQESNFIYAAVGDSTGIGIGARNGGGYVDRIFARIKEKRSDSTLINLCVAGATTTNVLDKQIARLGDKQVMLVTICVGINDLLHGGDEKQFAENYETLVEKLKQSSVLVVVANLPDVASAPVLKGNTNEPFRLRLKQFNKIIEETARRHSVPLVDLYKLSGETIQSHSELFSSDGLHPSDHGYIHWAEAMWKVIDQSTEW